MRFTSSPSNSTFPIGTSPTTISVPTMPIVIVG